LTVPVQLVELPAAAVTVMVPAPVAVTRPVWSTVPGPVALQVNELYGTAAVVESWATAESLTVLPCATTAGFGVTSHLATLAAAGAPLQVPPEQIWPLLQSLLAPQPGGPQVPSQTWPELHCAFELHTGVHAWLMQTWARVPPSGS
jgi:hypothetical protein